MIFTSIPPTARNCEAILIAPIFVRLNRLQYILSGRLFAIITQPFCAYRNGIPLLISNRSGRNCTCSGCMVVARDIAILHNEPDECRGNLSSCHCPRRRSTPVFPGCHSILAVLNPWPLLPGPNPFCDGLQVRQPLMSYFIGSSLLTRPCKTGTLFRCAID